MTLPAALALLLATYLAIATTLLGWRTPGYLASRDGLSHLAENGRRFARLTNLGVFLPIAIGCAWLALQALPFGPQQGLSLCLAIGYFGAVLWPLRPQRHPANRWHYLAGGIEYIGGSAALAWAGLISSDAAAIYLPVAGLALLAITLTLVPATRSRAGLWQRLAEASLFLGQYLLLAPASYN